MGKINIKFSDLCAFFTSKLRQHKLMVGLIHNNSSDPAEVHQPHITISERGGAIVKEYKGVAEVSGDIFFDVFPKSDPLRKYNGPRKGKLPFSDILDIETRLHPGQNLKIKPKECHARLYFRHGELYAQGIVANAAIFDLKTGAERKDFGVRNYADNAGIEVNVPSNGYAVLYFAESGDGFIFSANKDYEVKVTNAAQAIDPKHFQYYYEIVKNPKITKLYPDTRLDDGSFTAGGPFCMVGGFEKADYTAPASHFGW